MNFKNVSSLKTSSGHRSSSHVRKVRHQIADISSFRNANPFLVRGSGLTSVARSAFSDTELETNINVRKISRLESEMFDSSRQSRSSNTTSSSGMTSCYDNHSDIVLEDIEIGAESSREGRKSSESQCQTGSARNSALNITVLANGVLAERSSGCYIFNLNEPEQQFDGNGNTESACYVCPEVSVTKNYYFLVPVKDVGASGDSYHVKICSPDKPHTMQIRTKCSPDSDRNEIPNITPRKSQACTPRVNKIDGKSGSSQLNRIFPIEEISECSDNNSLRSLISWRSYADLDEKINRIKRMQTDARNLPRPVSRRSTSKMVPRNPGSCPVDESNICNTLMPGQIQYDYSTEGEASPIDFKKITFRDIGCQTSTGDTEQPNQCNVIESIPEIETVFTDKCYILPSSSYGNIRKPTGCSWCYLFRDIFEKNKGHKLKKNIPSDDEIADKCTCSQVYLSDPLPERLNGSKRLIGNKMYRRCFAECGSFGQL